MESFVIAFFILAFLPMVTHATPVKVEKVGRGKAIISFPSNVRLSPGSRLYLTDKAPSASDRELRPRKNFLEISFKSLNSKSKAHSDGSSVSVEDTTSKREFSLIYGYNTGRWMPWVLTGMGVSEDEDDDGGDDTKVDGWQIGAGLTLNLIKNEPENNFIPYISLGVGFQSTDMVNSSEKARAQGKYGQGDLGFLWYPFGELMAFDVSLTSLVTEDLDVSGDASGKQKVTGTGFSLGYALSF